MRSKKLFGIALRMCAAVAVSILAGILLLTAVYALPVRAMEDNMRRSAQLLSEEGIYPNLYSFCTSRLDNWTDATMLLIAAHEGEGTVLEQAMTGARDLLDTYQPVDSMAARYLQGVELDKTVSYARYWHGYLVFLKPLLLVTDYGGIRTLNLVVQLVLNAAILVLMFKRDEKRLMLPWVLSMGFLMPLVQGKSLQYSTCFYAFALGVLFLLLFKERWDERRVCFLFLGLGVSTAFIDFLTYPVAAFGIPAVVWLCMKPSGTWKDGVKRLAALLFFWAFGYGGMWAGKWVAASLLTEDNVIKEALSSVLIRTSHSSAAGDTQWGMVETIWKNVKAFLKTPVSLLAFLFVTILVILIVMRLRQGGRTAPGFAVPLCIVLLLPFLWYMGTVNHSAVHFFFTNKSLVVSAFAGLCLLAQTNKQLRQ